MAVHALGVAEHAEEETRLAEKAVLLGTRREGVRLGQCPNGSSVVKSLEERVSVRVGDVSLEARVVGLVVEAVREWV